MANIVTVDFSEASEGGDFNTKLVPEGDYVAKIAKAVTGKSKADNVQAVFTVELISPKVPRATYPIYAALSGKGAFKLRDLMRATGLKPAGGRMKLDIDKLVGRTFGVSMEEEEYNERVRSTIGSMFPRSEVTPHNAQIEGDEPDEDEDDIEPEPAPRKKRKPAPVEEDDDDLEDDEEEEPAPKPKRKRKPAPEPEPEDDDDEDDEEDEEPAPKPKRRAKKKPAPVEDDEDDDDIIDLDDI